MKLTVILLILAVFTASCTITVSPIKPTKSESGYKRRNHSHHHARPVRVTQTLPKPSVDTPNIKETWWIENYRKLEEAHGNYIINDDANIEPLPDGRFKVPDAVLGHYQDLLMTKPSPKP